MNIRNRMDKTKTKIEAGVSIETMLTKVMTLKDLTAKTNWLEAGRLFTQIKAEAKREKLFPSNAAWLEWMTDETGMHKSQIYGLMRAYKAYRNIEVLCPEGTSMPTHEYQIRPLATRLLNKDARTQALLWEVALEQCGPPEGTSRDQVYEVVDVCREYLL